MWSKLLRTRLPQLNSNHSLLRYSIINYRCFYTNENKSKIADSTESSKKYSEKGKEYIRNWSGYSIEEKHVPKTGDDCIVKDPQKLSEIVKDKTSKEASVLLETYRLGNAVALMNGEVWTKNVFGDKFKKSIWPFINKVIYYSLYITFTYIMLNKVFGFNMNFFGDDDTAEEDDDDDDNTATIGNARRMLQSSMGNDEPVERPDTKFDDVKGLGEVREQLEQVKDYMVNKQKYEKIGAALPKGILLSGPPGVGKTLLGRAIAGECGVPFYFVASSTIDGMYK